MSEGPHTNYHEDPRFDPSPESRIDPRRELFRRRWGPDTERGNHWQPVIGGMATGFAVRYALRALFMVAAAHVALPAMAAIPVALASAALIGAAVKIATVRVTAKQREKGWLQKAAWQGAAAGLLGGIAGDLIAEFVPVHQFADYISHHFFPQPPPSVPVAASTPPPVPSLDGAKDDIQHVLNSGMLRHSPKLWALGEKALQSDNPKTIMHFCKEASYKLINGHHDMIGKTDGAGLIRDGLNVAGTFNIQDHTVVQLNADEAYLKLHGLYGEARDITGSAVNAQRAGHLGERFLKFAAKLPKPAVV